MCFFSYACQGADDQFLIRLNKVRVHGETEDPICVMGDLVDEVNLLILRNRGTKGQSERVRERNVRGDVAL